MDDQLESTEQKKMQDDTPECVEAQPIKRPRLRSILKTTNDQTETADKNKQRKTVQFADDKVQVYDVMSYKKYNSFNETHKKKCCGLCKIF